MGLDLLKAPERDAAPELLVDWLELAAFFDEDGACWTWCNRDVRIQSNATLGRVTPRS
jgi:hypothetical protein